MKENINIYLNQKKKMLEGFFRLIILDSDSSLLDNMKCFVMEAVSTTRTVSFMIACCWFMGPMNIADPLYLHNPNTEKHF